jgi:Family of unknown function (DUF5522)
MKTMSENNCSRCAYAISDSHKMPIEALQSFLKKTSFENLCNNCTLSLENLMARVAKNPFPAKGMPMIENVHYYMENGFWVFTELYHASRGFCCKNGCRHCAYGFKKEKI